jgi:hypothetical protein
MNSTLFVICCKESDYIRNCIFSIKKFYQDTVDIVIVDSDSTDKSYFDLKLDNNLIIEDIGNKQYEYGSIIHGYKNYPNYDNYVFLQDSMILDRSIDELSQLNDTVILLENLDIQISANNPLSGFDWDSTFFSDSPLFPLIDHATLKLTIWNSFIIHKNILNTIINSESFLSADPPKNKSGSRSWERVWSMIFYHNNIPTKIIKNNSVKKIFGNRQ